MAKHSFLAIPVALIPDSVKVLNDKYDCGVFSSDGVYRLLTGYRIDEEGNKVLAHDPNLLMYWLRGEPENMRESIIANMLSNATEHTAVEMAAMQRDSNSIWYREED